ncbi:MAG: hydantoinase/oxoprolinase family protein [Acidimicrobiia bacterium]
MGVLVGIDVGGTFTDVVVVAPDGSVAVAKAATTPDDEAEGIVAGLAEAAAGRGEMLGDLLARTDLIVHATTTADNTLITHSGAPCGLITTEGHRDEIEMRRGWKESIWDPTVPAPQPIAMRRFRMSVPGRLDYQGNVLTPLDEDAVRRAARRFRDHGIASVAVVLLFSFVDPTWERRVREIVREEYPGAQVSLSHEVMPAAPEFERTSTTLVNSFVGPRVVAYLQRLVARLREEGYARQLLVMQSNGGVASVDAVCERPVVTLASGPIGGVTAAAAVSAAVGIQDFVAVDMGGTSYEACLVRGGNAEVKSYWNWIQRYCIALPVVDVVSIGAGGGSIARVNAGGLAVGPESAGADPGPICYGRGGAAVTVTDANVLLGYLNPEGLCGGRMVLDASRVEAAIAEQIAEPLGVTVLEAAAGVHRIVNADMNNAIRRVSSEKGQDPRKFALVAFGGNGPLHAPAQARELGIDTILVPRLSPVLSAFGTLTADFVVNQVRAHIGRADQLDLGAVEADFAEMRTHAEKELVQADVDVADVEHRYEFGCRYPGQTFTINVDVALPGGHVTEAGRETLMARFHELHEDLHTFATPDEPVVVAELRVRSWTAARRPPIPRAPAPEQGDPVVGSRRAWFEGGLVDTPVFRGPRLGTGRVVEGPAIVEESFTTVVLQPGQHATVDEFGNYLIASVGGTPR